MMTHNHHKLLIIVVMIIIISHFHSMFRCGNPRRDLYTNPSSKGQHRQHRANTVIGSDLVSVWTCMKCSCMTCVIVLKAFGPRTKLIRTDKLCELTHCLFWWWNGVGREAGLWTQADLEIWLHHLLLMWTWVIILWSQFPNPKDGITGCMSKGHENQMRDSE